MWCCCSCPSRKLLNGKNRRKQHLVREEELEQEEQEEEQSRRDMDVSLLQEEYRSSRDRRRRNTQVLLFRTVSEELLKAVSVIPVTQGLESSWEPNAGPLTSDPDPWHVHLGFHRRSCPPLGVSPPTSSPETADTGMVSCSRPSSSLSAGSTTDSSSGSEVSGSEVSRSEISRMDPVQAKEAPPPPGSFSDSHECRSSAPVAPPGGSSAPRGGNRKSFTRQLSMGGLGSSSRTQQNQVYPFPSRKTPRMSEAARRLGLYSSF